MIKIFNSLNNKIDCILQKKNINLYVCGITSYDDCHIGHGRTFIFFDVVVRYLRHIGYNVYYVRNITDIDDKIIAKSLLKKKDYREISNRAIHNMHHNFSILNMIKPDKEPLVTHHIHEIINMIKKLIKHKYAYISTNGDINFSINNYIEYGRLSNQILSKVISQKNKKYNSVKKNQLDFVLWKMSKKNEPYWNSPWGPGRPGWHIECSAINSTYFKKHCDIHGGGSDLLFPHHENEKAQSDCYYGYQYVKHWMHVGSVILKNKKMSKSLNNVKKLSSLLKQYDPEVIRFYVLSKHYRSLLQYNESGLKQANYAVYRLYTALLNTNMEPIKNIHSKKSNTFLEFYNSMNNDFNIPKVLSMMFIIVKKINILKNKNLLQANKLASQLKFIGNILGILFHDPDMFLKNKKAFYNLDIKKIELLIKLRNQARLLKIWSKADSIRYKLLSLGVHVKDAEFNTSWFFL
ncbi:Cysteine--tRNA ligase [Buchnera aphidicola (Thelaxes suberi)]|uniref:cysteine--tRNA ligase n=1 Tax=Buchnera aphidicola TaxID=9 RepID=UPI0034640B31